MAVEWSIYVVPEVCTVIDLGSGQELPDVIFHCFISTIPIRPRFGHCPIKTDVGEGRQALF